MGLLVSNCRFYMLRIGEDQVITMQEEIICKMYVKKNRPM